MEYFLPTLFFFVSFFYSSVGLGGGSSYTAIMAIMGINYQLIPATSLTLNLGVTFIGMINFWKAGYGRINLVAPFLITSIPMSYLAGSIQLPELIFEIILTMTLMLVVSRIYFLDRLAFTYELSNIEKWLLSIFLGSFLGFIAGSVGIGGGIYLVSNLGAGPRDGLMIGLQKKTNLPVAAVRAFLEISVVSIGWYLGGTVGVGTLLFAFGIGPCVALGLYLVDKIFD